MKFQSIRSGVLLQYAGLFLAAAALGTSYLIPDEAVESLPRALLLLLSINAFYAYLGLLVLGTIIRLASKRPQATRHAAEAGGATPLITPIIAQQIRASAPAVHALAMVLFLSVLSLGLTAAAIYVDLPRQLGSSRSPAIALVGLFFVLLAVLYAIPATRIRRYAQAARQMKPAEESLHEMLAQQLTIWVFVGGVGASVAVMMIIDLAGTVIGVLS